MISLEDLIKKATRVRHDENDILFIARLNRILETSMFAARIMVDTADETDQGTKDSVEKLRDSILPTLSFASFMCDRMLETLMEKKDHDQKH